MEENTQNQPPVKHHSRLNVLPILIIAGILYLLFKVDLNSVVNSPQFQKNILYIKTSAQNLLPKTNIDAKSLLKTFQMPKMPDLGAQINPNPLPQGNAQVENSNTETETTR